jgi:hypothetical protein
MAMAAINSTCLERPQIMGYQLFKAANGATGVAMKANVNHFTVIIVLQRF